MDIISGSLASVFAVLFGLIANILGTITGAFLGAAVAVFNFVTSESFISLAYTDPTGNQFIAVGWELTRDLSNIFIVLFMVVIGLGTALRITGYGAQKALPTLIIIALLINFTPVLLGLIVDASNIVMNFFVQGGFAGSNSFVNCAVAQWTNLGVLFDLEEFWNPIDKVSAAFGSLMLVFFNLAAGLIYLLFALIFILRYVAIWTLVILSPIAFACYILPATRKVFSQWWGQFLQWSLVGAIAAFFLYLADHFLKTATDKSSPIFTSKMTEIANAPGLASIMNDILPYFIALAFLGIGLIASITFAPKGADAILKGAGKGGKATGKVVGFAAAGAAWRTAKAGPAAIKASRQAFTVHRGLGHTRKQALGAAVERGWAATRLQATGELRPKAMAKAAVKGSWKAIKDAAVAGGATTLGIKHKKKGTKECPNCHNKLAKSAKTCTHCGYDFE